MEAMKDYGGINGGSTVQLSIVGKHKQLVVVPAAM